ncbi:Mor transcription activator family protein [Achromobacter xylosoxidans]
MNAQPLSPADLADDMVGLLPPVVRTFVAVIGLTAASALVRQAGGATIDVPKREDPRGEASFEALAEMIGVDAAQAMVKHFGGEPLYVPKCAGALREYTYRDIRTAFDKLTRDTSARRAVAILAVRYNYSDRRIWSILKTPDSVVPAEQAACPPGQLGLF